MRSVRLLQALTHGGKQLNVGDVVPGDEVLLALANGSQKHFLGDVVELVEDEGEKKPARRPRKDSSESAPSESVTVEGEVAALNQAFDSALGGSGG